LFVVAGLPAFLVFLVNCVGDEPVVSAANDDAGGAADGGDGATSAGDANGVGDARADGADTAAPADASDGAPGGDGGDASQGPKQAFVTADVYDGRFDPADGGTSGGGVAAADMRCDEAAASAFPGRTFTAWVATSGASAPSRLGTGPWYVGGALLGGKTELTTGALATLLDKTPQGATLTTSQGAWTGTDDKGAYNLACNDWSSALSADSGEIGTVGGTSGVWTAAVVRTCEGTYHLYCFEN
jgi:hypothetical protein